MKYKFSTIMKNVDKKTICLDFIPAIIGLIVIIVSSVLAHTYGENIMLTMSMYHKSMLTLIDNCVKFFYTHFGYLGSNYIVGAFLIGMSVSLIVQDLFGKSEKTK